MRLLFVILAHERPAAVIALARALTEAATDARAVVHFDANAAPADFAALSAAAADPPRIALVRRRVRCVWGGFGLVEATFNALAEAREAAAAEGRGYDYAILLSGACLPCRPVRQLERFLRQNAGREFIEIADESWPVGGLRAERWEFRHLLPATRFPWIERRLLEAQRLLGVKRRAPGGLTPRLGSQWWALTWRTCAALLDFAAANPATMRFFRSVWIPDEMAIQTLVHHLVPRDAVAGFGLTHFQFTNWGKPVVFFDDHLDYALTVPRFFLRKVSIEARALTERLLARAAEPDDGAPLDAIGSPCLAYAYKTGAQTNHPAPGQLFYGDQRSDAVASVLRAADDPYVVVFAPEDAGRALIRRLPEPPFARLGALLHPDGVDLGPGRAALGELSTTDGPVRDLHPALYLVRARRRAAGAPVLLWTPRCAPELFAAVLDDPNALVVAALPDAATPEALRRRLTAAAIDRPPPPVKPPRATAGAAAWLDALAEAGGVAAPEALLDPHAPARRGRMLRIGWPGAEGTAARRRAVLEADIADSIFAGEPWFPALVATLRDAQDHAGRTAA